MNKHYKIIIAIIFLAVVSFWIFHNFNKPKKLLKHKTIKPVSVTVRGRVAIVLDDWGYNMANLSALSDIKTPIAISVLPNLPYSKQVAAIAKREGYQVILHLPLESRGNKHPEKDTLYCSMNEREITEKLKQMSNSVPGISGVNNHQGSKATEDVRMMGIILSELKREGLFFLDSFSTNKSICSEVAKTIGIRYAKRDIFMDIPDSKLKDEELHAYIKGQLDKLCEIAIKRGYAIGIGHDRKITLGVLRDIIPQLKKKGIQFVFLSELVR